MYPNQKIHQDYSPETLYELKPCFKINFCGFDQLIWKPVSLVVHGSTSTNTSLAVHGCTSTNTSLVVHGLQCAGLFFLQSARPLEASAHSSGTQQMELSMCSTLDTECAQQHERHKACNSNSISSSTSISRQQQNTAARSLGGRLLACEHSHLLLSGRVPCTRVPEYQTVEKYQSALYTYIIYSCQVKLCPLYQSTRVPDCRKVLDCPVSVH